MYARTGKHLGFTITELLVVVGLIAVLMAILLPALARVRQTGEMTYSINNMKQIAEFMRMYSSENREFVVPAQFDYSASAANYPVKVRSDSGLNELQYKGTWTDILWTVFEVSTLPMVDKAGAPTPMAAYAFDSPDQALYELPDIGEPESVVNPFRARKHNTREVKDGSGAVPFGTGAQETHLPGFFAANDFFRVTGAGGGATPGGNWVTNGQIKAADRSMYLVDSYAGEVISPTTLPWTSDDNDGDNKPDWEVDFRYSDSCLMLFMDGHIAAQDPWTSLENLESKRRIRITNPLAN